MSKAYLGLGSNIGDPVANLNAAVNLLDRSGAIAVLARSRWYGSAPVGYTDQPDFVNGVIEVSTTLSPEALLTAVKEIEQRLGRTPTVRWGPRLIDIDILDYIADNGERVVRSERPITPHPSMHQRRFVLQPLAELAPDWRMPDGRSINELLANVQDQQVWPTDASMSE
ncbi:MAG: 2-amino-4-hydroxy-6-hydroxymethyldihydropteridine diphosphokinase [Candidatus Chloroheliales bacterium]|nr:MAG: 2-amino-4-hydroxy-6-hydroxymethyldihydropteridine diphosphokinase [Chloroflexota bacterium]